MSYIRFRQVCEDCQGTWEAAFGMVGTTFVALPPRACPKCGSSRIAKQGDLLPPEVQGATPANQGVAAHPRVVVGYMDKIDFDHELGAALGGNRIYPSVDDLKANSRCWDECGIVEVEVRLRSIAEPGKPPLA